MEARASAQQKVEPEKEDPFTQFWAFSLNPKFPDENDPSNWYTGDIDCKFALEHYNETKGVDFELVKVVGYRTVFAAYFSCLHFNFEAKPKHGTDQSPCLFFAEVCVSVAGNYVNICEMLDPSSPDAVEGCRVCSDLLHPKGAVFVREPPNIRDWLATH